MNRKRFGLLALIGLALCPCSRLQAQTLLTGLVGHWSFDEGSGIVVGDSSGRGNNGTLENGGTAWTTGHFGGALSFPGTTGSGSTRVLIPNSTALQITSAITFAVWVRVDDISRDAPILAKEGNGLLSYWFGAYGKPLDGNGGSINTSPGGFGVLLDADGSQPWSLYDRNQGSIAQGTWVHLASTWNGSQVINYVNGTAVGSPVSFSAVLNTSTAFLAIGVNAGYMDTGTATAFDGIIDDLYLYDRALSSTEINQLMNGAAIPEPSTCAALTGLAALALALLRRKR